MPLFRLSGDSLTRIKPRYFAKERELQRLFEGNLEELMGIRFVASEFSTGEKHGGRIDTLGLDENDCPVIIEYKLSSSSNIINQGVFYLNWLLDHKGDFEKAVREKLGTEVEVAWNYTRVVLIAQSFNKFDHDMLDTISIPGTAIELKSYRLYGDSNLYLEDVYSSSLPKVSKATKAISSNGEKVVEETTAYSVEDHLDGKSEESKQLFNEVQEYILGLDENMVERSTKKYVGYASNRTFCEIYVRKSHLRLYFQVPYSEFDEVTREMLNDQNWGGCALSIKPDDDLEPVFAAIKQSYDYFQ